MVQVNESSFVDFVNSTRSMERGESETMAAAMAGAAAPLSGSWARIAFKSGRVGLVDLSTERGAIWLEVLDSLTKRNAPAYIQIDPISKQITQLLIPKVVTVGRISQLPQGVEVELIISHAVHILQTSHPRYEELLNRLKAAQASGAVVAVTEDPSSHDIIEVSELIPTAAAASPEEVEAGPEAGLDVVALAAISLAQAQRLFQLMNTKVCCPSGPTAPCIPFGYPDDGCWGRAHEMYRLMANEGVVCNKVWIYGSLRAATTNNPHCDVRWGWHVAPTLQVNTGSRQETYVIDPSLFTSPVTQATWAGVQGDPSARLVATAGSVFYRSYSGATQTDPSFTDTDRVLAQYRDTLRLRSVGPDGPPPYPACLPTETGVQFSGTISAGATHSWFTYGWPARWHVLWTIMPLTTCAGAPQLKWRIRVERADANNATYWIVVTNTTNASVRFAGRYDILSR
jgi:hypothetical protein